MLGAIIVTLVVGVLIFSWIFRQHILARSDEIKPVEERDVYSHIAAADRESSRFAIDTFDIVFSFDTTGSMYGYLEEVRTQLGQMVQDLRKEIPGIRIAIYAHGDYCDAKTSYVTKFVDFTNDPTTLCDFVRTVSPTSGGDAPECYELVMREVQESLRWLENSQKALVLIGDALPHDKDEDQNYRHLDWKIETQMLRDQNIKIYSIQCNTNELCEHFFQHIASKTFGYYMQLSDIHEVKDRMMQICFREAGIYNEVNKESTTTACSDVFDDISSEDIDEDIHGKYDPYPITAKICNDDTEEYFDKGTDCTYNSADFDDTDEDCENGDFCTRCKARKPLDEFPIEPVSEKCHHYPGICLRCVVKYVTNNAKCPQGGCGARVEPNCPKIKQFQAELDRLFKDYHVDLQGANKEADQISVSTINGDTAWVPFVSTMTISQLNQEVARQLHVPVSRQKLVYRERGLKEFKAPGQPFNVTDFGIGRDAALTLILPLYCIPERLDHVVFDLSWHFPVDNPDFLDASCLAFEKTEFVQVIDWNHSTNEYYLKDSVMHSAKNVKTAGGRIGHQTIHVHLKSVPGNISHLHFTLSSWRAPNLSAFKHPRLQFYEASDPGTSLCSTTIGHALNSQAVIMCWLVKVGNQWQIFECGANGCVDGNTKRYNPIRQRISEIIEND